MDPAYIWGVVRTILASVLGGYAAKKGIDGDTLNAIFSGLGTVFVAVWSVVSKMRAKSA